LRPESLDLHATWTELQRRFEERSGSGFELRARVPRRLLPLFLQSCSGRTIGAPVEEPGVGSGDEVTVRAAFPAAGAAAATLRSFGADVEVIEPAGLRARLANTAQQVVELYARPAGRSV
jgi:hypothetical protein